MRAITRSYLVELYLGTSAPGQGAQINFQDYPELRNVYVSGVEVCSLTYLLKAPSGRSVVSGSLLPNISLNLTDINTNIRIYNYPTFDLQPSNVNGYYRDFEPFKLNLVKSFITILDGTGFSPNESLCFNFFYIRAEDYERRK